MSMRALLHNRLLVLGVAFVVACGAAIGVSAGIDGDDTDTAQRPAGEPVPVVAPVATGGTPPGSAPSGDDGDEPLSQVVGASAAAGGSREDDAEAGTDEPGDGDSTDAGSDTDRVTILTDACAGPEPGSEPADDCPDGTGATVLALTEPSPQWVTFLPRHWSARCPSIPGSPGGDLRAIAATLNPGTLLLEYWPTDDPGTITAIERSTASESDAEHRLWQGWFEDGTLDTAGERRIQYCLVLRDLRTRESYTWRATSTDIFGSSDTAHGEFEYYLDRPRPPVTIRARDDTHVTVLVPLRSRSVDGGRVAGEHAYVAAVPRSGPGAGTCSEREAEGRVYVAGPGSRGQRVVEVDGGRSAEDYPWDPAYDRVHFEHLVLDEGTTTSICIWWGQRRFRSFDADSIIEREVHLVTTPNRYRARILVERVRLTRRVDAGDVRVSPPDLSGLGGELCPFQFYAFPGEDVSGPVPRSAEPSQVICDLTDVGDTASVGDSIDVSISGVPDGPSLTTRLDLSRRPCNGTGVCEPVHTDWYRLNIPAERAVECFLDRLCPPDTSVGSALLRVDLVDGPAEGGDDYAFGEPASFTAADVDLPPPPPYPQLDTFGSRVLSIPDRHDALSIRVGVDRDATVRVFLPPGEEPCLLPGATGSAVSAAPAQFHSFEIDGLCAGHYYNFALEMTDTEGNVSYAADWQHQRDVPEPRDVWDGSWALVPAFEVAATAEMRILALPGTTGPAAPHNRIYFWNAVVSLNGEPVGGADPWSPRIDGCSAVFPVSGPFVYSARDGSDYTFSYQVDIAVDVDAASAFDGCGDRGPRGRTILRATVPTEEWLREPVVLTSPPEDDLRVEVTIVATAR
jgi:hypothetical protein